MSVVTATAEDVAATAASDAEIGGVTGSGGIE